jgi:SAM-dependent methyltransferase
MKALYRHLCFLFRVLFYEMPRGLDFHLKNEKIAVSGKYNGYGNTIPQQLKQIFAALNITEDLGFIDIGCGKGFVLTVAAKYSYRKITGIDIAPQMILNLLSILDLKKYLHH